MSYKSYKSTQYTRSFHSKKNDRWDHQGFDQLETEDYGRKNSKYQYSQKPRRNQENGGYGTSYFYTYERKETPKEIYVPKDTSLQEEKFENFEESESPETMNRTPNKKPDQPLYRPRQNRGPETQSKSQNAPLDNSISIKSDKSEEGGVLAKSARKDTFELDSVEDPETKKDEERESVSSESTANSEKLGHDEANSKKIDTQKGSFLSHGDNSPSNKPPINIPIFEIHVTLYNCGVAGLKIVNDDDFELVLDRFCTENQIRDEDSLPLKIQIVKYMLMAKIFDFAKLNSLYEKLLLANYQKLTKERFSGN